MTKWAVRWLFLMGLAVILCWTTHCASASLVSSTGSTGATPRELKALRMALKKQHRAKELQQRNKATPTSSGSSSSNPSGEYVPESGPWSSSSANEPTCEQLRAMWRQSKRHSRAAEATNEIPKYDDPFARSYGRQLSSAAETTLRPRQERRPVIYGRLHSSPADQEVVVERPVRPFDVLRKLNGQHHQHSRGPSAEVDDPNLGVVLYSEEDKIPFGRASARGSFQQLREQAAAAGQSGQSVRGSFQQLRDIVREEQQGGRPVHQPNSRSSSTEWADSDVGRLVTSPAEHSGSKYSLYSTMQGDAPYEESSRSSSTWQHGTSSSFPLSSSSSSSRRHNQRNSSGGGSKGSGNRIKQSGEEGASRSSNKVFHKVDPPRGRVGQQHRSRGLASSSFNEPAGSSSRIQGYATVVEKPYHPAATKSSRSRAAETQSDCNDEEEDGRRGGCRNDDRRRRCLHGRCTQQRSPNKASSMLDGMTEDDIVQDLIESLQLDEDDSI